MHIIPFIVLHMYYTLPVLTIASILSICMWWKLNIICTEWSQLRWFKHLGLPTPSKGYVPDMPIGEKTQRQTQDTLEWLFLSAGQGTPWYPLRGVGGSSWVGECLGFPTQTASPATQTRISDKMRIIIVAIIKLWNYYYFSFILVFRRGRCRGKWLYGEEATQQWVFWDNKNLLQNKILN